MNAKRKAVYVALLVCAAMLIVLIKSVLQGGGETAARLDEQDSPGDVSMSIINPNREIRGVWIASVYNINFPSSKNLSADSLRAELDDIVKTASANGLNTILFQVRPMCDALYKSSFFRSSIRCTTLTRSANSAMIVWKSNRISDVVIRHPSLRLERRERNSKKLPSRACFAPKSKTARPVRSNSRLRLVGQRLSAKRIP